MNIIKQKHQNQQVEKDRSAKILAFCQNCTHRKFEPQQGLICGLTSKFTDFNDECEQFEPNESYIAQKRMEREQQEEQKSQWRNNTKREAFILIGTYLFCLISMLGGENASSSSTIYILLAAGVTLAGGAIAYYLYGQNLLKKITFGLLTNKKVMEILRIEGYYPQEQDDNIVFKVNGDKYDIRYKSPQFILRSVWTFQERNIALLRAIAEKVSNDLLAIKITVSDFIEKDQYAIVVVSIEALISYEVELQEQISTFIRLINMAVNQFLKMLQDFQKQQIDSKEKKVSRRRSIYQPEYGWLAEMVDAVSNGKLNPDALSDENWLKQGFVRDCDPILSNLWDEFKILRIEKYGDYKLIIYKFPEPKEIPEALYGAVLLNNSTNEAVYYTLEYSYNEQWVLGALSKGKHANYGTVDTNDLDEFISWIFSLNKELHAITELNRYDNKILN